MTQATIRVGVIGCGGISRVHLPFLSQSDKVELVALCDHVEQRVREKAAEFGVVKTYNLHKRMVDQEALDAVFCLVRPDEMFRVADDCLERGLHVFMEKPPGINCFQARTLARRARRVGKTAMVGFNRRYIPVVAEAVKIVRESTVVNQVEGTFIKHGSAAFCQGAISALESDTIHAVDMLLWMAGGKPVKAATVQGGVNDVVENRWASVIAFDNGVTGILKANYQTAGRVHGFEMHGPEASAFMNLGFGAAACEAKFLFHGGKAASYSLSSGGAGNEQVKVLDGFELAGSREHHKFYGFWQEDEHFIDCIINGRTPLTDIETGVAALELIEMIRAGVL